tara:strand:- start:406 stop:822 length:417 start_codon:yes stop_codon:yes gene_type:complete
MTDKTFISSLNYKQVDIFSKDETIFIVDGEEHFYFNVKIHWGLHLYETMKELDIVPFVDRIEVVSGDSITENGKIIVPHEFLNIKFPEIGEYDKNAWKCKNNFLRDDDAIQYRWHCTILPKFIAIDVDKKIVEIIFNA